MAEINPVESVTYSQVRLKCKLTECDVHILASTLWSAPVAGVTAAGMIVGALRYGCAMNPCIVDDVAEEAKIWYGGIVENQGIPIVWLVHHECAIYRVKKRVDYYEWPVKPISMNLFDARCVQFHLARWVPNSMAAAFMKAKALAWLKEQPIISDTELGYSSKVDISENPFLTVRKKEE